MKGPRQVAQRALLQEVSMEDHVPAHHLPRRLDRFADQSAIRRFPLLADPDQAICTKYGVWQEKSMYGKKYMGAVRTTYLIDPKGKVAHRWDKVKVPGHAEAVLAAVQAL